MLTKRFLEAARAVALASQGTGPRNSFRVGAVLLDKNRIITAKSNSYKTHPVLAQYSNWPFQHAESACIISHGLDNCDGLDLLVTRVNKKGSLTMAKPCDACLNLISDVSLRNIYYTNWEGKLEQL